MPPLLDFRRMRRRLDFRESLRAELPRSSLLTNVV